MICFTDPVQTTHEPQCFLVAGKRQPSPEAAKRVELLRAGAADAGCQFQQPKDYGTSAFEEVHSTEYLQFLRTIFERWAQIEGAGPEVIPNVHPIDRRDTYPSSPIGQAGFHQADTACPIGAKTYAAAYASAQTALSAAELVSQTFQPSYALCRPPGHHACRDRAGGFCYLNNAAIAAQFLTSKGRRAAVLDIDVHHGNGTQDIFYGRSDVLTVSLHTDPNEFYPFFRGHAEETGCEEGLGANLNIPLPRGTDLTGYRPALDIALNHIADFGAQIVVLSLGLDAHISDPFQGMALQTQDFTELAQSISAIRLPLVVVQEGGYISRDLRSNLTAFLSGLQ